MKRGEKSPYCPDAPARQILTKLGIGAEPDEAVMYAKFHSIGAGIWILGNRSLGASHMKAWQPLYRVLHAIMSDRMSRPRYLIRS